ncbi:basic proline-rich protein-like [Ovis aries]|uniref:basic proline-rich protein-like n=1 Tax=Ovis aries TaxID=9940 RepID=UPI001C2EC6E5|nr:basic proline-rich protein-like [Ovis aries]
MAEAPGFGGVGGQGRAPQSLCQLRLPAPRHRQGLLARVCTSLWPWDYLTLPGVSSSGSCWWKLGIMWVSRTPSQGRAPTIPLPPTQATWHCPAHTCPAPGLASSLLPAAPWPRLLAQEAAKCPFPARSQPRSPPGQARPPPPGMAPCPPARAAASPLTRSPALSSSLPAEPGHHCQGWGSDRGGGAPGTPSSKAVRGGVVREAPEPASARRRWAVRVPRPLPPTESRGCARPARGSLQPEEEESRPALGLAHPAGGGRDRGLPAQGVYLRSAAELQGPSGPASARLSGSSGAVTSFLPSSSQTGTGAAPAPAPTLAPEALCQPPGPPTAGAGRTAYRLPSWRPAGWAAAEQAVPSAAEQSCEP